jgi:putative colanic acid biosynthesis acetyltransferase WcaF
MSPRPACRPVGDQERHHDRAPARDPAGAAMPRIFTVGGVKQRPISKVDLARYRKPTLPGNRGAVWRAAWYLVNALLFQHPVLGLGPSRWKAGILRAFGAKVGQGFVCKPRVTIKYPWFLELGENVWLGEGAWIDNHCTVRIGSNCCISQSAYLFTGNHDWGDARFAFRTAPITIGDSAWIGAGATICPGSIVADGDVVGTGFVMTRLSSIQPSSMPIMPEPPATVT